ncbi:hypothetical protein ES703_73219 [subsurface metagenome]
MKQKEFSGMLAEEYKEQLKDDYSRLVELWDGIEISTKQEAIKFLVSDYPNFGKILETSDPVNWLPEYIPKIMEAATGNAEGIFDYLMSEIQNPQAFDYKKKIWPIIIPHINYLKKRIDCLEFSLDPYAVCTIEVNRIKHEKEFDGWIFTFPSSEKVLCLTVDILSPTYLNMTPPTITLPLRLLRGLTSGDVQPEGCEVIGEEKGVLTYQVEGFDNEVVLSNDFLMFIMELGEKPLDRLKDLGLLSEITLKILTSKKEVVTLEPPVIREKDRKYLRIIQETEGFLTFGGWGEALELTRDGAYRTLTRLEEDGLVNTEKHESGEGTRASLTSLGLAAIR